MSKSARLQDELAEGKKPYRKTKNLTSNSSSLTSEQSSNIAKNEYRRVNKRDRKMLYVSYFTFGFFWIILLTLCFFINFKRQIVFELGIIGLSIVSLVLAISSFELGTGILKLNWKRVRHSGLFLLTLCIFVALFSNTKILSDFLETRSLGVVILSLAATGMVLGSFLKSLKQVSLKFAFSIIFMLIVVVSVLGGTKIWQIKGLKTDSFPQMLQVIFNEDMAIVEARLPEPNLAGFAVRGFLEDNKIEVYIVPFSFYKSIRGSRNLTNISDRYEAVFIPETKGKSLEAYYLRDTLRLTGQNVSLNLKKDTYGPILNNDKNALPVLVLQDVTFQSITSKALDTKHSIFLWSDKDTASAAMAAYSFVGFQDKLSSNHLLTDEQSRTLKSTLGVLAILLLMVGVIGIRFFISKGIKPYELYILVGVGALEGVVILATNRFIDVNLAITIILLSGGITLSIIGLYKLQQI